MKSRVFWTVTIRNIFSYVLHLSKTLHFQTMSFILSLLVTFFFAHGVFFCELSKFTPILEKRYEAITRAQRKGLVSVFLVPFGFGFLCLLTGHFEHRSIFGSAL